jgi:hypothetical protein
MPSGLGGFPTRKVKAAGFPKGFLKDDAVLANPITGTLVAEAD